MIPISLLIILYFGLPLAGVLVLVAAVVLRKDRPKRARLVIWPAIAMALVGLGFVALMQVVSSSSYVIEDTVAVIIGGLGAIAAIGAASLLFPLPENTLARVMLIAAFAIASVTVLFIWQISQVNFGL